MSDLGRVVVVAGGLSAERDVSLRSGRRVAEQLRSAGVDVQELDADGDLLGALAADPPAAVFPVVHGRSGEDGSLGEVFELLDLPYVGSRPGPSRLAWDKPVARLLVSRVRVDGEGVAVPVGVAMPEQAFRDLGAATVLDAVVARVGLPLVVKPDRGGSSQGTTVVTTVADLPEAMVDCFGYGSVAQLERFVAGTEVAVTVLEDGGGARALPAVEIVPDGGRYDYDARYSAGLTEFFVPARLPAAVLARCAAVAVAVHTALGLRDLSRTDLIVDAAGVPWFLEVNVSPGLTETSLAPQALLSGGLDLGVTYRDLVVGAVARLTPPS